MDPYGPYCTLQLSLNLKLVGDLEVVWRFDDDDDVDNDEDDDVNVEHADVTFC